MNTITYLVLSDGNDFSNRFLIVGDADNIDSQQVYWEVSNTTHGIVKLKWIEPSNPNSMILTYQVEYWRTDIENVSYLDGNINNFFTLNSCLFAITHFNPIICKHI